MTMTKPTTPDTDALRQLAEKARLHSILRSQQVQLAEGVLALLDRIKALELSCALIKECFEAAQLEIEQLRTALADKERQAEAPQWISVEDALPTVKHVHEDGLRDHVLWWDSNGTHCSVKNCEINAPSIPTAPESAKETA